MISSTAKDSSTDRGSPTQAFHKAFIFPAIAAIAVGAGFFLWHAVVAAPALSFGAPGQVHFAEPAVLAGSEPLVCFDAIEWKRLCPGTTFMRLTPANVASRTAVAIDLEPHQISTPTAAGRIPPKCRATKIPAGLAPGVWKLTGHATNTCSIAIGTVMVSSELPAATVIIKTP